VRRFGTSPCRAIPEGQPPSPVQHRSQAARLLHRNLHQRSWHTIVGVPFERDGRIVPGHPPVEHEVPEDVRQQGGERTALPASAHPLGRCSVVSDERCFQPPLHVQADPPGFPVEIGIHRGQEFVAVEVPSDVEVDHPGVFPRPFPGHRDRVQRRPARPVPERVGVEPRLRPRAQHQHGRRLGDPVSQVGTASVR